MLVQGFLSMGAVSWRLLLLGPCVLTLLVVVYGCGGDSRDCVRLRGGTA